MSDNKIYIAHALKELAIGRTKLYALFTELNIKPQKQGRKSYLTDTQLSKIKEFLAKPFAHSEPSAHNTNNEQVETILQARIEQLETELAEERNSNKQLVLQVGQWQGRAKTLEEQNVKLLKVSPRPLTIRERLRGLFGKH